MKLVGVVAVAALSAVAAYLLFLKSKVFITFKVSIIDNVQV